jgi:F420-dependent oxidoreductase-like protein
VTTGPLRFGISLSQHYHDWPALAREVALTEECGFDDLWVFDHFVSMRDGVEGPTLEAWMLLAGFAAITTRVRLGTLVTGNTYRHPSLLAKQVVSLDHISNGRAVLGIGAGWHEGEHRMYGFPFPPLRERVDRLGEALELIDGLMRQARTTFAGRHYQLEDAVFEPKPIQRPRIPILVGAKGPRMLRFTARHADIWDADAAPTDPAEGRVPALLTELAAACREVGRDPATLRRSVWSRTALRDADETRRFVRAYHALGFTDFYFKLPDPLDPDAVRRVASAVLPELRGLRTED